MKKLLLLLLINLHLQVVSSAQYIFPPTNLPQMSAIGISGEINVDGVLNEREWEISSPVSNFVQIEPNQGMPSEHPSQVKVVYSSHNLYVGVFCADSLGQKAIRVPDMTRDFNWRAHDTFAICIDGFNDHRNSVAFATNPYGTQKDYLSFDDIFFDGDWNGLWKVRTTRTEAGWYAEFEIPWKTIRYAQPEGNEEVIWNANFLRLHRASNEISAWSAYPRSFGFNRMEYSGVLKGVRPPPPGLNVQVNPYTLASGYRLKRGDRSNSNSSSVKVGGEIKWTLNSHTTLDVTANTDFAQADADIQVNNVGRFSVLFPEKRQFFLENASMFSPGVISGRTGGNMQFLPFFSRRIGLNSDGNPLPVDGGLRLVSRTVKQSVGIMVVRQGALDTVPGSTAFVGRYSRNLSSRTRLGSILTYTSSAAGEPSGLAGMDGFIRLDETQSLNFLISGSSENGTNGVGGYAQYFFTSNKFTAWWTQSVLTEGFSPALGFVARRDIIGTTPGISANLRGKHLPFPSVIRSFQPGIAVNIFHRASTGTLTEQDVRFTPFWLEMQNGGYVGFSTSIITQNLQDDFQPLGVFIPKGRYSYTRYSASAGSDPSRKLSVALQHDFGAYYDGTLRISDVSLSVIPIPHLSFKASVNSNRFTGVGSEGQTKEVTLYTIQGRMALNPRIQLTGLYQRTNTSLESYNVRFSWEYQPLSYVYLVFNSREAAINEIQSQEQQGIVKVSFLKQF